METMWQMVIAAAEANNTQIFATTHNSDCIKSLARADYSDIGAQRVEAGKERAIHYSREELEMAADHNIEIR